MAGADDATQLLRRGLLEGVSVLVAGAPQGSAARAGSLGEAVAAACEQLGATVSECSTIAGPTNTPADGDRAEEAVSAALQRARTLDLLVLDGAALFEQAAGGAGGARAALRACLDGAWKITRAVVNLAFLPAERGGRILYLAPRPGAGEYADAARAGLENLARTLSVEWARHAITAVTIAPGDGTSSGEVGALVSYLASPAGAYFSGCLMDLRGVGAG